MPKLLVIFDIDETLIHFVNKRDYKVWAEASPKKQKQLDYVEKNNQVLIFRPYLRELFEYFVKNKDKINVGLWTYSEREYAEDIGGGIIKHFGLPKNMFLFRYGYEDMEDETYPKDLRYVYRNFPEHNTFNTILVDDAFSNISHAINSKNSILIAPFAPFGWEKKRVPTTSPMIKEAVNDKCFQLLEGICKKVVSDIEGCDSTDIRDAFTTEGVFAANRVKRMKLDQYYKKFAKKSYLDMMSVGKPLKSDKYSVKKSKKINKTSKGGTRRRRAKRATYNNK